MLLQTDKPVRSLFMLSLTCLALCLIRYRLTGQLAGYFLAWNLCLAWIPLLLALSARWLLQFRTGLTSRKAGTMIVFILPGIWLLFLPNAPYIITDLIHLHHLEKHMLWFDSLAIFLVALTGLGAGLYSVYILHSLFNSLLSKAGAWGMMLFSLVLSGFGLYLGRFVRFNSWDLFTNPGNLFRTALTEIRNPLAQQMTFVFAIVLISLYLSIYYLIPRADEAPENAAKF